MARLPIPGSDDGTWGQILNDFLGVEHNQNGTLKADGSLAGKANSADLAAVATSGEYSALLNKPANVVEAIVAGTNVTVDGSDPANPVVNSSGTGTAGVFHYLRDGEADSSIAGYDVACHTCGLSVETSKTLSLAAGDNHFGTFISRLNSPGVALISEGFWLMHLYYRVSVTTGVNTLKLNVFKRNEAGVETSLFSFVDTADLASTTQVDVLRGYSTTEPISLDTTDRIVYKLYITHSGGGSPDFTVYFNGNTRPSHVHTPIMATTAVMTRTSGITSASTITPTLVGVDQYNITALAEAASIAAPTGTPTDGRNYVLRIKDNGTLRALSWNAIYRPIGVTLPASTTANKTMYVGMTYNAADSVWDVRIVDIEA